MTIFQGFLVVFCDKIYTGMEKIINTVICIFLMLFTDLNPLLLITPFRDGLNSLLVHNLSFRICFVSSFFVVATFIIFYTIKEESKRV